MKENSLKYNNSIINMQKSNAESVKEFTEGYLNKPCPSYPQKMTKEQVLFIIRMVMSELDELAATVSKNEEESSELMKEALSTIDKCHKFLYKSDVDLIAAQADSMVDAWYYMLNIASKHGMNLSKIFDIVHEANMDKRDPITKKFIRRESDGKVLKREGWQEPNINAEIERQFRDGTW
jgi:predicted HAD superfamily Cof-like phosphohydrolase